MTDQHYTPELKICIKCEHDKPVSAFAPGRNACRQCRSEAQKLARIRREARDPEIAESRRRKAREYASNNRDAIREYQRSWVQENRELVTRCYKAHYEANGDKIKRRSREWRENNIERKREANRRWAEANSDRCAAYNRKRKEKDRLDSLQCMKARVGTLIRTAITKHGYKKASKTKEVLGCDWDQFKDHIERQFTDGMSWENRSEWHLDHIVPISSAGNEDEVIALNHYTNLRPLWAKDNLSKAAKNIYLI